jgi:hypothetical protein
MLLKAEPCKWRRRRRVAQGERQLAGCLDSHFLRGQVWHFYMLREKFHSVHVLVLLLPTIQTL